MKKLLKYYTSNLLHSIVPCILASFLLASCNNEKGELKHHFKNDFESYADWGISGYSSLYNKEAYSGNYCWLTDSAHIYSLTFSRPLSELSNRPITKMNMSVWIKFMDPQAKGSYILSVEKENNALAYFSFDSEKITQEPNKWYQVKGVAEIPEDISPDALVKIYFWNKGGSVVLVDDMEFSFE